tara:strand:- start:18376 stop:19206 length:831 start_codon:yes stop_codon:yes gene_type:complete
MTTKAQALISDFQEHFELDIADNDQHLLEQVFRIRYRVYCEEFKYEPAEAFDSAQEKDEFDEHSVHCLVTHNNSGLAAGCVRLVTVDGDQRMPMEKYCASSLDPKLMARYASDRDTICEFSRLAVDGAFRRRAGERASRFGELNAMDCSAKELRSFSMIAVSNFLAGFAISDIIGRTHCFAMMEPFLPRLLKRSGILVERVGSDIEYHGIRAPYFITTESAVAGMPDELRAFYQAMHMRFSESLQPRHAAANLQLAAPRQARIGVVSGLNRQQLAG